MAKFKVGDKVKIASGETLYAFAPESGPAKGHAYEILEGKLSLNSRVCNSSNPVVRNAMNAKVSMNSVDAKDKEEMAKFFKLMNDTISEISRLDMEFASYIKGLLNKAEKTQDKDLADWLQKANLEWKNLKIKGKIMR